MARKLTLEYFAQRLGTKDFNMAALYYLAFKGSGLSLAKWLGEGKRKYYRGNKSTK